MKKLLLTGLVMMGIFGAMAQDKPATQTKKSATQTKKPATQTKKSATQSKKPATTNSSATAQNAATMKNALDSFSYALGVSMAEFYKSQGIRDINLGLVNQALNDVKKSTAKMSEEECNSIIMNYMESMKSEKAAATKKEGQAFLEENKKRPGVVSLPSGLQYEIISEGNGPKPGLTDTVTVHYHGTLIDGTIFDSSRQRGESISFPVNGVIKGWVEALQLMPKGSTWKLFIPSDLAYGDNQAGPVIKPGSTLVFEVELIDIKTNR